MADRHRIGAEYRFTWEVERGKIRELASAIGDENPVYNDPAAARAAGYPDIIAPPTFTTVPVMWSEVIFKALDDLNVPLAAVMHAEQRYEFLGYCVPGDTLSGLMSVKSIESREGKSGAMDFILFEITFTNQREETVVREELLVVERK